MGGFYRGANWPNVYIIFIGVNILALIRTNQPQMLRENCNRDVKTETVVALPIGSPELTKAQLSRDIEHLARHRTTAAIVLGQRALL
jgi:hypothetical protein